MTLRNHFGFRLKYKQKDALMGSLWIRVQKDVFVDILSIKRSRLVEGSDRIRVAAFSEHRESHREPPT